MNWLTNLFIGLIVYPDKKTRHTIGYCIKSVKEQTVIIAIVFTQPTREKKGVTMRGEEWIGEGEAAEVIKPHGDEYASAHRLPLPLFLAA